MKKSGEVAGFIEAWVNGGSSSSVVVWEYWKNEEKEVSEEDISSKRERGRLRMKWMNGAKSCLNVNRSNHSGS